jgi:cell division septum initiation protein DivIVA
MTASSEADGRLTPDTIWSYPFPSARLGKRGLEEAPVWEFCRLAEREIARLLNEKTSLTEEVQRLRRRVLAGPEAKPGDGLQPEDAQVQAVAILSQAQQAADRHVAEAQEYGRQLTDEARRLRDEILDEARSYAEQILEEARRQASLAAEASPDAPMTQKGSDRAELEAELTYLRSFSDVYRAHLRSYLDQLVRDVEEWDRAEKESVAVVHADMSAPPDVPPLPPLPRVSR